ncbi:sterol desaturase family protein [Aurantiacibacter sp. MUD11]|uniref:sterol desaturase family protein n=1 Tax=Aurantiacibacter sp. MUD11 TaxID=3003265 RepID=UPI0022AACFF2|nr:sterol desaturase family protein [Aurantiacibacter sp. MUD11]WAT18978.1 sterol desaturase family protein [Aurantiacibacter sp. MUD11]
MDGFADNLALERFGDFLSAQALLIYCVLVVAFAMVELALPDRQRGRAVAGKRNVVNFALGLIGMGLLGLFPVGTLASALLAREEQWGLFNHVDAHPVLVLLAAIATQTFVLYWIHRATHAFRPLWRIHRVHHADTTLDLSTGLRHHPVEVLLTAPFHYAVVIALGLPVWAALLTDFLMFAGSLFKHLDIALPRRLERALGTIFATPALHRYHHSEKVAETDSNFGNLVIIWDRLFGTYHAPQPQGPARIGLGTEHDGVADRLGWQLRLPLQDPPRKFP